MLCLGRLTIYWCFRQFFMIASSLSLLTEGLPLWQSKVNILRPSLSLILKFFCFSYIKPAAQTQHESEFLSI